MAATVISPGETTLYSGSGTADNEIVLQTDDISRYKTFMLASTAGVMDVYGSLDGTTYLAAPLTLIDCGTVSLDPVLETAATKIYAIRGVFRKLRVLQKGAVAVVAAQLLAGTV